MSNPDSIVFLHLPYNTDRIYVRGICHSGCEIWLPITKDHNKELEKRRLQEWLDNQPIPEDLIA